MVHISFEAKMKNKGISNMRGSAIGWVFSALQSNPAVPGSCFAPTANWIYFQAVVNSNSRPRLPIVVAVVVVFVLILMISFFRLSGSTFNNFNGVCLTSWKAKCIFSVNKPYYRSKVASDRLKIVRAHFFIVVRWPGVALYSQQVHFFRLGF